MNVTFEVREVDPEDGRWVNGHIVVDGKDFMHFTALRYFPNEITKAIISTMRDLMRNPKFSEWKGFDHKKVCDAFLRYVYVYDYNNKVEPIWVSWKI